MNMMKPEAEKNAWKIFILASGLFSLGVIGCEITRIDVRFALMVQDMVRHGVHFCPTINGVEYGDYFSPWVLLVRGLSMNGHFLNLWTLSLPAVLCGAYTAAMTYFIGERHRKNLGLLASGLLFCSVEWLDLFTGFGVDAGVMAAAVTLLWVLESGIPDRRGTGVFALLLFLSFAVRGPMGGVLLGATAGGYLLAGRNREKIGVYGVYGVLTLVLCTWGAYFLIMKSGGAALWDWIIYCQFLLRTGKPVPLQVLGDTVGSFAPVSIFCLCGVLVPRERYRTSVPVIQWAGAFLLLLLVMCFPSSVHMRYLVAGLPFAALFAAWVLLENRYAEKIQEFLKLHLSRIVRWETGLCIAGILLEVPIVCLTQFFFPPLGHLAAAVILLAAGGRILRKAGVPDFRFFWNIGIVVVLAAYPVRAARENSRPFVERVQSLGCPVYFFEMGPDYEDLKYLWHVPPEERGKIRYTYDGQKKKGGFYDIMYPRCDIHSCLKEIAGGGVVIVKARSGDSRRFEKIAGDAGFRTVFRGSGYLGHKSYCAFGLEKNSGSERKK